ncbi:ATP-binding transport protein NatA [Thermoclostridium stercorarium subsp. stercorarium DSM 8532]|jgi:ABC-2 type transport system ATP-binding protein|uniref:ATP-binding transport protein NatA n=3 Tax=Thermoclostridium stercorarium TaxID=1510 RepID=L7VKR1_THES1|nr:ATP-binding cassette domain-containing protein [Thermoclostridium stercorarium]AGC67066.1 ATP-binding transport protein NatA [Thermoclostridium stercorarium subsp. stercorarium DSM 8532]AGI38151.1 ABC transporter ATPase subunit [Thermoclostridium stercorarium subsp. stercorarium DSM 8532]
MIHVSELKKTFVSYERGSSFTEALLSLFVRKKKIVEAVKGISFDIEEGELVGFLGPNGAGKSTTIKILTGILHPTSGTVNVMGFTPWKERKKYVRHIGAVFGQKSQLLWDIPPLDAFYLNQAIYRIPDDEFKKTVDEMVEMLDLKDLVKKPTRQLSLGERMKCEFIMAMLHKPPIIFLDEPTIGLDVIAKEKIRDFIREQNKKGTTFILTTHDLEDVERLAKRVIVINHGEIVFDGSMDKLKKHLGEKRTLRIATWEKINLAGGDGIDIRKRPSEWDVEVELDLSKINLNEFIQQINEKSKIRDMSIEGPELEEIIKKLYTA